ncbi:GntR family transcriptional regulator [Saccharothrix sp. BKS2]|uniref:FadR/GntR family transcriptional regulator n=1 Tax=Saccharothrix sp. BKS2 TaxID=3064400 RepID=UPI0039E80D2E
MTPLRDALFRPVRAGNAFEETVERLVRAIRLGVVGPGERLPAERELAGRLGVSRVTLREAIRSLQDAGYVESRRGRYGGTFVTSPPPVPAAGGRVAAADLVDALTWRAAVETGAAECAAGRALDPVERRDLLGRLAECGGAALEEYRRKDSRLHLAIAEATGSASLTAAVADARTRVNELLDRIPLLSPNLAHSNAQHEGIVGHILAGNGEAARRAMAEHLDGTAVLLRGFLA